MVNYSWRHERISRSDVKPIPLPPHFWSHLQSITSVTLVNCEVGFLLGVLCRGSIYVPSLRWFCINKKCYFMKINTREGTN